MRHSLSIASSIGIARATHLDADEARERTRERANEVLSLCFSVYRDYVFLTRRAPQDAASFGGFGRSAPLDAATMVF